MIEYVQVGRRFTKFDPKDSTEADDYSILYSGDHSAPLTWTDVLAHQASVIIAEGQSGNHIWARKDWSFNTEHRSFLDVYVLTELVKLFHRHTHLGMKNGNMAS
jgi:hypothetical protein